jgi:hypothetical protein
MRTLGVFFESNVAKMSNEQLIAGLHFLEDRAAEGIYVHYDAANRCAEANGVLIDMFRGDTALSFTEHSKYLAELHKRGMVYVRS